MLTLRTHHGNVLTMHQLGWALTSIRAKFPEVPEDTSLVVRATGSDIKLERHRKRL